MPIIRERRYPPLSPRQKECLTVICRYIHRNGYPPTQLEIGDKMKISTIAGVRMHLAALEKKGRIIVQRGITRGINVIDRRGLGPPYERV